MPIRPFGLSLPPATGNSAVDRWLQEVRSAFQGLPFSFFSTTDGPNTSAVSAPVGFFGIELGSSVTKLWFKQGSSNTTGWVSISPSSATTTDPGGIILDDVIAGRVRNATNDAGIALDAAWFNAAWQQYINLASTDSQPFIKHPKLEMRADGTAIFSGELQASSGWFDGELRSTNFNGANAVFSGNMEVGGNLRMQGGRVIFVHPNPANWWNIERVDDGTGIVDLVFHQDNLVIFRLGEDGVGYAPNGWTTSSDGEKKQNVEDLGDVLDDILRLRPIWYEHKDFPGQRRPGFIAQEVSEIFPDLVFETREGPALDYGRFTPLLVAALRTVVERTRALEDRVAELEARVQELTTTAGE
jgi:hypothetical protein